MNFECHITIRRKNLPVVADLMQAMPAFFLKWKTSAIDGDPVMGDEVFGYLTAHDTDYLRIHQRMSEVSAVLEQNAVKVLREKIELIMHDVRHVR